MSEASKQRARERKFHEEPDIRLHPDPSARMSYAIERLVMALDEWMDELEGRERSAGRDPFDLRSPRFNELHEACSFAWAVKEE